MCAPSWFHQRHGSDESYDLSVYKNDGKRNVVPDRSLLNILQDEYFDDLGIAYRAEIKELYELGCRE